MSFADKQTKLQGSPEEIARKRAERGQRNQERQEIIDANIVSYEAALRSGFADLLELKDKKFPVNFSCDLPKDSGGIYKRDFAVNLIVPSDLNAAIEQAIKMLISIRRGNLDPKTKRRDPQSAAFFTRFRSKENREEIAHVAKIGGVKELSGWYEISEFGSRGYNIVEDAYNAASFSFTRKMKDIISVAEQAVPPPQFPTISFP